MPVELPSLLPACFVFYFILVVVKGLTDGWLCSPMKLDIVVATHVEGTFDEHDTTRAMRDSAQLPPLFEADPAWAKVPAGRSLHCLLLRSCSCQHVAQ